MQQWLAARKYLISVTGFDACSLQPTSGASGEYAGLLVIKKYLEAKGEGHRDVCIIPRSAHGTNPASAAMCGMEIKWIEDSRGMDIDEFKALCAEYKEGMSPKVAGKWHRTASNGLESDAFCFFEAGLKAVAESGPLGVPHGDLPLHTCLLRGQHPRAARL